MDRNQFIGLILMFALLAVYFTWFAPEPPAPELLTTQEEPIAETVAEATSSDTANITSTLPAISDSAQATLNTQKYGDFAFAASGTASTKTIENDELILT
ncbi:MAG: hypothetical protein RLP12_06155, partial [Ekhidna sp.]